MRRLKARNRGGWKGHDCDDRHGEQQAPQSGRSLTRLEGRVYGRQAGRLFSFPDRLALDELVAAVNALALNVRSWEDFEEFDVVSRQMAHARNVPHPADVSAP